MYMVQTAWPQANLVGVDMSTYKLAISQAKLDKKPEQMRSKVWIMDTKAGGSPGWYCVCLHSPSFTWRR